MPAVCQEDVVLSEPIAFGSLRRWPLTAPHPFAECQLARMVSRERWANSERSVATLLGYRVVPRNEPRLRRRIFLLNLNPDFVHPSLGPVCPVFEMPNLRLKVLYPLFGGSKLRR